VDPRDGLQGCGKSRPHQDSIPDRPAHSESLYRLSYRGPYIMYVSVLISSCCVSSTTAQLISYTVFCVCLDRAVEIETFQQFLLQTVVIVVGMSGCASMAS
jgi:hypothetical protein